MERFFPPPFAQENRGTVVSPRGPASTQYNSSPQHYPKEGSRVPQGFASTGTAYFVMNIASTVQSASLNRHPDPVHDLNPSTAASSKQPISPAISVSSGANSIPYSTLKPIPRRSNLPPLPDLRFEQSYLASLQNVEGWTGVLWVTGRDQVCSQNEKIYGAMFIRNEKRLMNFVLSSLGFAPPCARHALDTGLIRLALLEPRGRIYEFQLGEQSKKMVVGSQ